MYIAASFVLLVVCIPLLWMIISAFKSKSEVLPAGLIIFPSVWHFDNFAKVFKTYSDINFFMSYMSTLGVATVGVILSLAVNSMAGYAFARLDFPLKRFFWCYVVFQMFIPGISILITSIKVVSALKMMNTFSCWCCRASQTDITRSFSGSSFYPCRGDMKRPRR